MGCGASSDPKIGVADSVKPVKSNGYSNSNNRSNGGFKQVELKNNQPSKYSDPRNLPDINSNKPPLAFVISFDENNKNGEQKRPPPGRLRLEPLKPMSKMTKEELDDKMRAAEANRERILAERAKSSGSRKRGPNGSAYSSDRNDSFVKEESQNFYKNKPESNSRSNNLNVTNNRNNDYERNEESRQRILKQRRIVQQQNDDSDIEHDRNYQRDEDDFSNRRFTKKY